MTKLNYGIVRDYLTEDETKEVEEDAMGCVINFEVIKIDNSPEAAKDSLESGSLIICNFCRMRTDEIRQRTNHTISCLCNKVHYCSQECVNNDLPFHKLQCS